MTVDLLDRVPPKADYRIAYGKDALQFGDLWLPSRLRPPVCVFLHGGWWKAKYGLAYAGFFCQALKSMGIAVWSVEYRRVGDAGGGYPGTFLDVAQGFDHLPELAKRFPLDLSRVVAAGHSAGGQLAYWLAGRQHIPETGALAVARHPALPLHAVIALAGAVDLRLTIDLAGYFTFAHDKQEVLNLMGGNPKQVPEHYRAGDPGELLPLNVPQFLVQGTDDDQIPAKLPERWAERGRQRGEQVVVEMIPGAEHFDVVDPESKAWPWVADVVRRAFSVEWGNGLQD